MSKTEKQDIGQIGEDIAASLLTNKGFKILERNYRKKWGEIDIVCIKDNTTHFVEVKTLSYSHNLSIKDNTKKMSLRPEDNVHHDKLKRLGRAIQTYLSENRFRKSANWQLDIALVYLDYKERKAKIRLMENIIIGA